MWLLAFAIQLQEIPKSGHQGYLQKPYLRQEAITINSKSTERQKNEKTELQKTRFHLACNQQNKTLGNKLQGVGSTTQENHPAPKMQTTLGQQIKQFTKGELKLCHN